MSGRDRPTSASGRRRAASIVALTTYAAFGGSACEEPQPVAPVAAASAPQSTSRFAAPTVEVHVSSGGLVGGTIGGVIGNSEPKLIDGVLIAPFAVGMTRPSRISGRDPVYTQEAREAKVEGFALVRCVIEIDGFVTHCEIVKAMPFMSDEILGAVKTWRFTPALRDGHPVRVLYTIPIRLRLS